MPAAAHAFMPLLIAEMMVKMCTFADIATAICNAISTATAICNAIATACPSRTCPRFLLAQSYKIQRSLCTMLPCILPPVLFVT